MINKSGIIHRTVDNYCYPLNEDEVVVNLLTGYEVKAVKIIWGDPFSWGILGGDHQWMGKEDEVVFTYELPYHIQWHTTIKPKDKRLKYYFELKSDTETLYFFENGLFEEHEINKKHVTQACFTFPWLNPIDVFKVPKWVHQTIWYQIFPERFANGDTNLNPLHAKDWKKGSVKNEDFYGGDLIGIINKLDYLNELGITGIYLTPIFESTSSHKYNTNDYFKIDKNFGTEEDLKRLVTRAHELNIKIMLDLVFNHCGESFPQWLDVKANGSTSKYYDWFFMLEDNNYHKFAYVDTMPKLNTNNSEVQEYLVSVTKYWKEKTNIDGVRIDVANEISLNFNRKFREEIKSLDPDFFILGEIWHDAINWLRGDQFDSVMNYPLTKELDQFFGSSDITATRFKREINQIFFNYPIQVNDVLFNLLDSHDTNRIISRIQNSDVVLQMFLLLFALPGTPCVFYGTEILLKGKHDPDCRRCMPWDEIESGKHQEITNKIKGIISLRNNYKSMHTSYYSIDKYTSERTMVLSKYYKDECIMIYFNLESQPMFINDLDGEILLANNYQDGEVKSNGFVVIKKVIRKGVK